MRMLPALGSISRISVRTRVDLPEPDRPMTTNTSPGWMSIETSRTATTQPVFSRSSARESSASGVPMMLSAVRTEDLPDALGAESGSPSVRRRGRFDGLDGAPGRASHSSAAMIYQRAGARRQR